jgi:hypothetical protein
MNRWYQATQIRSKKPSICLGLRAFLGLPLGRTTGFPAFEIAKVVWRTVGASGAGLVQPSLRFAAVEDRLRQCRAETGQYRHTKSAIDRGRGRCGRRDEHCDLLFGLRELSKFHVIAYNAKTIYLSPISAKRVPIVPP